MTLDADQRRRGSAERKAYQSAWARAYREANLDRVKAREKAYYEENKERLAAQWKAYHEGNRERRRDSAKARRETNLELARANEKAQRRARRDADPDRAKALGRAKRAANPERRRADAATRRARKRGAFVESVNPAVVFDRDGGICGICDSWVLADEKWHVDHIHPISKGGDHSYANSQLAHAFCNLSKHNRVPA